MGFSRTFCNVRNSNANPDTTTVTYVLATVIAERPRYPQRNDWNRTVYIGRKKTSRGRFALHPQKLTVIPSCGASTRGVFRPNQGVTGIAGSVN